MSQSATLYRIPEDIFRQLNRTDNKQKFDIENAKSYYNFQGTFMGLEFILTKNQNNSNIELVREIFNPKKIIGGQELINSTPEEEFELYENGVIIPYIDQETVSKLNDFVINISKADIHSKYNAKEFNDNGIYPEVWHNDNSIDNAYNEHHLMEDFDGLKTILKDATNENDYIIVFIG